MRFGAVVLGAVVLAVYASTIGMTAFGRSDFAGAEPHHLLTARSLADDGDVDLVNQYRDGDYLPFHPYGLAPEGDLTDGRLNEPHGLGFPALIAPAYAAGGEHAVEALLAVIAALAVVLAYRLALRAVPDPWALGAAATVGLAPPLVAYSTSVYPELTAGAALTGAALLALGLAERPSRARAVVCFALVALLPWLGIRFAPAALVVGGYAYLSLRRAGRGLLALAGLEIVAFATAVYVGVNGRLYGGPSPDSAGGGGTGADSVLDYLGRIPRLATLWLDPHFGLLRWAPIAALALAGALLFLRERRTGLRRAIPTLAAQQSAVGLCAAVLAVQLLVAAFLAPAMSGHWFPGRHLVWVLPVATPLVAVALRRFPRVGTALGLVTVAGSVWLWLAIVVGDASLIGDRPPF
ncbi:MAG TPA: hypothetical protein VJT75_02160 [Thermoleophilaceae bacterium]|nr:hypothetical protein [Thermoleophilaceae bacterium]